MRRPLTLLSSLATRPFYRNSICHGCFKRSYADLSTKPFFVTTPIFYVNADPHLGHLYSMVLADIIRRWQLLQGRPSYLLTGVDEHGLKVQKAAQKAETPTQQFCDRGANVFRDLAAHANVDYTCFARTSDPRHKSAVQHAWMLLKDRGYIYESQHEGWYAVSDETFYTEADIHIVRDPTTGRKKRVAIETGSLVEWTSETNYKFRLSDFRDRLLEFYDQSPHWLVPDTRMSLIKQTVADGLADLSISRPSERVQWGIPVPHDKSQNIYVWLDALMNYTVQAGYPWPPERSYAGGWPADVHVIGKDIIRFHAIYWPAFLMGLELPLPAKIISHAHWTIGGSKMSKSTGNVVNPFTVLGKYGIDGVRWYLALEGKIQNDAAYNNVRLADKYEELRGKLGNFASRLLRSKRWKLYKALRATIQTGRILDGPSEHHDRAVFDMIRNLKETITPSVDKHDVRKSLMEIMNVIYEANSWFHNREPWKDITKDANQETMSPRLEMTIALCAEALRICGILLQPYMPEKAKLLLDQLGVDDASRGWDDAVLGADTTYGQSKVPLGRGLEEVLFLPVIMD